MFPKRACTFSDKLGLDLNGHVEPCIKKCDYIEDS